MTECKLFQLPSLPAEERASLPDSSGVYIVVSDEQEVLYVGRSVNLRVRWATHMRWQWIKNLTGVRIYWDAMPCADIESGEDFYIASLKPSWNGTSPCLEPVTLNLGDVLYKWRAMSRLGLRGAGREIGLSAPSISRIENGETVPDGKNLMKIFNWLMKEKEQQ